MSATSDTTGEMSDSESGASLTLDNLAPLAKMSQQRLLRLRLIRALLHLADIQCPVDAVEGTDSTHVVSVFGVLFAPEAVFRVVYELA
jgi:hypothetical protein